MYESIKSGGPKTVNAISTLADGVSVRRPSDLSYAYINQFVDDIFLISEGEIKQAMKLLFDNTKVVVEGAGAITTAAILKHHKNILGKKIGLIVTGGNVDPSILLTI